MSRPNSGVSTDVPVEIRHGNPTKAVIRLITYAAHAVYKAHDLQHVHRRSRPWTYTPFRDFCSSSAQNKTGNAEKQEAHVELNT